MTYVVDEKCIKCKHMDCVEVCPVDCFYEGENMLVIHPDTWAQNMAVAFAPLKLPRCQPSDNASPLIIPNDLPPLPPPALAMWDRLMLICFYNAHQDLKQDLLKERMRGV